MSSSKRLFSYDIIRAVAMTFVVATHAIMIVDTSTPVGSIYHNAGQLFFITANALFFMLSGKFNCRERQDKESLIRFYTKRFRNFIIPVLIYFFVRTLFDMYPNYESVPPVAKAYLANLLSIYSNTEYWFVFVLFGFILCSPFLAHMATRMNETECIAFLIIGIVYNFIMVISMNTGIEFGWGFLFSGFGFTFFIGAILDKIALSDKAVRIWYFGALLSLIAGVFLRQIGWGAGSMDISPFYTVLAIGIYLFILRKGERTKPNKIISFLAQHSFGVYLTHMMVLWPLLGVLPVAHGAIAIPVHIGLTIAATAGALLFSVIVDTMLVKPLQKLFDLIGSLIRRSCNTTN